MAVDGCGQLPGTWVAKPQGHTQNPQAASSRHWVPVWLGEEGRICLHQYWEGGAMVEDTWLQGEHHTHVCSG